MIYDDFIGELNRASLSVRAFAELVRMNPNSVSNYAGREVPAHLGLIAALMADLRSHGIDYTEAVSRAAMPEKKPRGGAARGRFGGDRQQVLDLSK
ncbi:XRE family transcriptional regulator [Rhizobium leguminosarum bv. viciae]|uniref:XRE family transcriptional regulator n=1 Tax=Rhizobium leguminosarum bv. viciae TaxID=387 RepID=A0A8I2GKG3_RHILV|nr:MULTISPECIES: XRE family transcriptional regulator [Rhizobium]MBY3108083.1 XRE family transcriptional regulator [Rhizobium laguerreae]NKM43406.1 XRE family transcriptional regulator [Rhizobium leguminosarum bv. viciae]